MSHPVVVPALETLELPPLLRGEHGADLTLRPFEDAPHAGEHPAAQGYRIRSALAQDLPQLGLLGRGEVEPALQIVSQEPRPDGSEAPRMPELIEVEGMGAEDADQHPDREQAEDGRGRGDPPQGASPSTSTE